MRLIENMRFDSFPNDGDSECFGHDAEAFGRVSCARCPGAGQPALYRLL